MEDSKDGYKPANYSESCAARTRAPTPSQGTVPAVPRSLHPGWDCSPKATLQPWGFQLHRKHEAP